MELWREGEGLSATASFSFNDFSSVDEDVISAKLFAEQLMCSFVCPSPESAYSVCVIV